MSNSPACSLTAGGREARLAQIGALFGEALVEAQRGPGRLALRFEEGYASRVEALAAAERECCPFLDIAVQGKGTRLAIGAPEAGEAELEGFAALAAEALAG